jgi:hypothetical protein
LSTDRGAGRTGVDYGAGLTARMWVKIAATGAPHAYIRDIP